MKPVELIIENVGILESVTIPLNKDGVVVSGDVRQGKTTILNSIKFLFGTSYPPDLIRHGEQEASITMRFKGGELIKKEFYRGRDGSLKNRKLIFLDAWGAPVSKPVDKIKQFLSPFTLNQDHLINMTAPERKRYFMEVFDVDTKEIDSDLATLQSEIKQQKAIVDVAPKVAPEPVAIIDPEPIRKKIAEVEEANESQMKDFYRTQAINRKAFEDRKEAKRAAEEGLEIARQQYEKLKELAEKPLEPYVEQEIPKQRESSDLKAQLETAIKSSGDYRYYKDKLVEVEKGKAASGVLAKLSAQKKDLVSKKFEKLKEINDQHNIAGLVFNDSGSFTYEDTDVSMLSTSQLMRLTSEMSKQYPDVLKLETVDRAESLGDATSVIEFITRAAQEGKTILASVVGEFKAESTDKVGVFIVKDGKIQ